MVNEVALGLLFGLVGWKVALTYLGFGLAIAIVSGWVIGRLHLEHWLEQWVCEIRSAAADLPPENLSVAIASKRASMLPRTSSARFGHGSSPALKRKPTARMPLPTTPTNTAISFTLRTRELSNAIERAIVMSTGRIIFGEHVADRLVVVDDEGRRRV
jgi:uncharacterized membrane protein YraQ (UPF0718 family)